MLLLSCPVRGVARALLIPMQCWRVLLSCRALPLAGCVVCGWRVCVCAVRVVGYPLRAPPSRWWWVGPLWMVGCRCGGGWHGEGRAAVLLDSPSNVGVPRLRVGVPLVVYSVALLNDGRGMRCDALSSDWVWHLALSVPLHVVRSPRIVPVPFLSCVAVFVVGGEVRWVWLCSALLFCLCVPCHGIVGLGLCLCDRVM